MPRELPPPAERVGSSGAVVVRVEPPPVVPEAEVDPPVVGSSLGVAEPVGSCERLGDRSALRLVVGAVVVSVEGEVDGADVASLVRSVDGSPAGEDGASVGAVVVGSSVGESFTTVIVVEATVRPSSITAMTALPVAFGASRLVLNSPSAPVVTEPRLSLSTCSVTLPRVVGRQEPVTLTCACGATSEGLALTFGERHTSPWVTAGSGEGSAITAAGARFAVTTSIAAASRRTEIVGRRIGTEAPQGRGYPPYSRERPRGATSPMSSSGAGSR
ncbi:hypothetical protein GCM10028787_05890 [Brachybacterium horti]